MKAFKNYSFSGKLSRLLIFLTLFFCIKGYGQYNRSKCYSIADSAKLCISEDFAEVRKKLPQLRKHINEVRDKDSYEYYDILKHKYNKYNVSRWYLCEFTNRKLSKIKVVYFIEVRWNNDSLKDAMTAIITKDSLNLKFEDIKPGHFNNIDGSIEAYIDKSDRNSLSLTYIIK